MLSVLLAVGLELFFALTFGRELRYCSPPRRYGSGGYLPSKGPGGLQLQLLLQQQQPHAELQQEQQQQQHQERENSSFFSVVLKGLMGVPGGRCGVEDRGVYRQLISFIASLPNLNNFIEGGSGPHLNAYICIGFIFLCTSTKNL